MMVNPIDQHNPRWSAQDSTAGAQSEINRLSAEIEREKSDLSQLNKELAKHISNGDGDTAQIKSALIQQKQLEIQMMQLQIQKLDESGQPTSDKAAPNMAVEPQPAAVIDLSAYAQNLIHRHGE